MPLILELFGAAAPNGILTIRATKITCHPSLFSGGYSSLFRSSTSCEIILTSDASNNISLKDGVSLPANSVVEILRRSNNEAMSGKTITFKTGQTVQDDEAGTIQSLYNSVVANGATIANLTVIPA